MGKHVAPQASSLGIALVELNENMNPPLVLTALLLCGVDGAVLPPVPSNPGRPTPFWSWATLPLAFHGANRTGMYTEVALQQLSRYSMVTLEKWYTACAAKGPVQSGPECDVEDKMFTTFRRLKSLNPKVTTVMYLNSLFDFAF